MLLPTGRLIALEGIDGAGKGTQYGLLLARLQTTGITVKSFSFPLYGLRPDVSPTLCIPPKKKRKTCPAKKARGYLHGAKLDGHEKKRRSLKRHGHHVPRTHIVLSQQIRSRRIFRRGMTS